MASAAAFRSRLSRFGGNLCSNLAAGLRAVFFLRVAPNAVRASWLQLIALLLLGLLVLFAVQFLYVGSDGQFTQAGVAGSLLIFPLLLLPVALVAALANRREQVLGLVVIFLGAALWLDVLYSLYWFGADWFELPDSYDGPVSSAGNLWLALAAAVAMTRRLQLPARAAFLAGAICCALIAVPLHFLWRERTLWTERYDDARAQSNAFDYLRAAQETTLYAQPRLLDEKIAQLQAGTPDVVDLYFVGMAGYAEQDVFMKEVDAIAAQFAARFDTAGRSIKLINNRNTLDDTPLASVTALGAALRRIGAVMNADEDILFLYLTSHGSQQHELSLQMYPLQLAQLDAPTLKKLLDDAAIRWRVIVISACYSGGFIEPLQNDDTLIITAAARDKTSFGCSNDNDYTYFSEAYFQQALARTPSFVDAFALAKDSVTRREKAEGFEPSQPQMAAGKAIATQLEKWRSQHPQAQRRERAAEAR